MLTLFQTLFINGELTSAIEEERIKRMKTLGRFSLGDELFLKDYNNLKNLMILIPLQ